MYLCLLIYGICFIILYDQYISFVIFTLILATFIIMLLLAWIMASNVQVNIKSAQSVVEIDDNIDITVEVENKSILPVTSGRLYITCQNAFSEHKMKKKLKFSLDIKEKREITFSIIGKHCGMMFISVEKVGVYDYLKVWQGKKKIGKKSSITVMPHLLEESTEMQIFDEQMHIDGEDTYSLHQPGDDISQIFDIRSYQSGDRAQRIHWKLSSKRQEWMVKEYSLPLGEQIEIWFDFYCPTGENTFQVMDQLFAKLRTIMMSLSETQQSYQIIWYNKIRKEQQTYTIQTVGQIEEIFDLLFCTPCYQEEDLLYQQYKKQSYEKKECYYVGMGIWEDSFKNGG